MRALIPVILLMTGGVPAAQQPPPVPAGPFLPTIVTSGEAVVRRTPDRVYVTAAVETRARRPREAQERNAVTMTLVQQRLAAAGLAGDAVRTLGYEIHQEVDFVDGRRVPRDYVARNAVEVRLDAVERTGEILDLVVEAGASSVPGIRFDLRDRSGAEREALRLAVLDARARADIAAAAVGSVVERVLRIDDSRPVEGFPPPRPMMTFAREADQAATPIEPGLIEIRAQAVLTVSIR
jgi:uncharacterized protein YggE